MVQSIPKTRSTTSNETFISEIADIKVFETRLLDYQSWQAYYQDLSLAAEKFRDLIEKSNADKNQLDSNNIPLSPLNSLNSLTLAYNRSEALSTAWKK